MKKATKRYFLGLGFLLVFFMAIFASRLFSPLAGIATTVFEPLEKFFYSQGLAFTSFRNYKLLVDENQRLKEEISSLAIDYVRLANLESENDYLRRELDFLTVTGYSHVMTNVIGRQQFDDQVLIIDKGSADGLTEGMPATVNQGIILGKLVQVEEKRSFVRLLNNTHSQLAVTINDLSGTNGLLLGRVGNSLIMDFIPRDKEIKVDDLIITSGSEEQITRGLLVGRVEEVEDVIGQIFKKAKIEPLLNYQTVQVLSIITDF